MDLPSTPSSAASGEIGLSESASPPLADPSLWPSLVATLGGRWLALWLGSFGLLVVSLGTGLSGLAWLAAWVLLGLSGWQLLPSLLKNLGAEGVGQLLAWLGFLAALVVFVMLSDVFGQMEQWLGSFGWDAVGALGEVFGAAGQILIAILAAYIAWQQYVISRELTIQQNLITQQQTIDAYFEGISGLVLSPDGQLDDWPLERAIAEGRTAAIMNGVDRYGKAKILRFLSMANLLSPLRRDEHLGRPILDGSGGYQRDRLNGTRVVNLRTILERTDLSKTELRGIDFSDISLEGANLSECDLSYCNFSSADLRAANLQKSDLHKAFLFAGSPETATPGHPKRKPNFKTGEFTGALIQGANFQQVKRLSDEQRYYLCAWGGAQTRATVPGGCQGIPDRLSGSLNPLSEGIITEKPEN
ncbi:MAG: pentapeptide repeat-containing protein [Cyanobacteriota bacterium]|nr:pentapeptide repeat-containing protein [Cyanobacteriota bacterium]